MVAAMNTEAVMPSKFNRVVQREYDKQFYRERHLAARPGRCRSWAKTVECFFNKLKQFRRVFSRFDQTARNYLTLVQFASMMIWLR